MTVQISEVLDLQVNSFPSTFFNFNSIANLDAGITQSSAVVLTYKSNEPWHVGIQASTANFTGSSPTAMPASVVQWTLHNGTTFTPLSTVVASVNGSNNARGTGQVTLDFKMNPGYIYAPATDYSLTVVFTLTAD
jgi:spore coat protein U-like protein